LWTGLVGPRGIPEEIVQKLAAAAKQAVIQPNVRQFLSDNSYETITSTPEEFDRDFRREYSIVPARIRQIGIEPN
jgi:tripartite-type tricarboxylate transporter receptor subunit TctC